MPEKEGADLTTSCTAVVYRFVEPVKKDVDDKKGKKGGRNNNGRITVRHKGGGHKQRYRIVDFKRDKDGIPGVVERLEYDPNRSAHLALVKYSDGERRYILAPRGVSNFDFGSPECLRVAIPAANGLFTARSLAKMYAARTAVGAPVVFEPMDPALRGELATALQAAGDFDKTKHFVTATGSIAASSSLAQRRRISS